MLPTLGPTSTRVGGAEHATLKLGAVHVAPHVRWWNRSVAQPAPVSSTLPGTHELAGWPVHAAVVNAQYCVHVFFCVPQLPHGSSMTVPGMHPLTSSLSQGE